MRKEEACSTAKRLLAAFMTAAMAVSIASPLVYAADETAQLADTSAQPVVVDQQADQTADVTNATAVTDTEPTLDTDLTYNDTYANTAPTGMEYAGTLDGMGMNVYRKEITMPISASPALLKWKQLLPRPMMKPMPNPKLRMTATWHG